MTYDPDHTPDPVTWLALDATARREVAAAAHLGIDDVLHPPGRPTQLHAGMHATVETMFAEAHPAVVHTMTRMTAQGVRRHAVVHMIIDVLMARFTDQAKGKAWTEETFDAVLHRIDAGNWIGARMRRDLGPVDV